MIVQMARFKINPDIAPQLEEAVNSVFKAVERKRSKGIGYSVLQPF